MLFRSHFRTRGESSENVQITEKCKTGIQTQNGSQSFLWVVRIHPPTPPLGGPGRPGDAKLLIYKGNLDQSRLIAGRRRDRRDRPTRPTDGATDGATDGTDAGKVPVTDATDGATDGATDARGPTARPMPGDRRRDRARPL